MWFKKFTNTVFCVSMCMAGVACAQSQPPSVMTSCLEQKAASTLKTPFDLWNSIPACVAEDKYQQAIFMFGLAGALGVFDSMRVKDPSAGQAAKMLPMGGMAAMGDKSQLFQQKVHEQFGNDSKRLELCEVYKGMPPPTYFPNYLINHGLAHLSGNNADPFVPGFDAVKTWPKAVDTYMECPKDSPIK